MAGQTEGSQGSTTTTLVQDIAPGILTAFSVYTDDDSEQMFQTYCIVDLIRGGNADSNRNHKFASGYVSEEEALSWEGFFELQPDDQIRAFFRGNLDPVFRVTYQRLTTTADGALRKYLIDVLSAS